MYDALTDDAFVPAPLPQFKLAETTYLPTSTPCGQGRPRRGALVVALVLGAVRGETHGRPIGESHRFETGHQETLDDDSRAVRHAWGCPPPDRTMSRRAGKGC